MTDLKYFSTTKKGEIFELKAELLSDKKDKKREAVKKIIANMTVGKDVSALFPDVVNCMQTDNLELKKLVYLYLMNYAKTQPDLAILAVNTFVKDCEDPNPLIRALAVRTMGCIRVDKISEYLCIPLRQCLKDEDPYVRKTAAVCVAKLYDINPELVNEQGFIQTLVSMIGDSNPMVVSNAVAALSEIAASRPSAKIFELDSVTTNKLLTALNECSEWGQVFLMDAIATYVPREEREALSICERVTSRLAHANAAVVLGAVKVLMLLMERMDPNSDFVKELEKKLAPPLVTLLSAEPEIQYVALRNINIILQRRPEILKNELRVFFVKYNDPIYVKLEKLDIMIRLTNSSNINQVLSELKEYATEVDVEFVCKAVRAIGRCAIKVEEFAERCISSLLDLVKTRINYVVQESVVVIKDIFRKYPNRYEGIISTLCENLDSLDEPEARASMIWIIGEYADRIENSTEILSGFLDGFAEETNQQVQLQLLTAIVKAFLKKPMESQNIVTRVLQLASEECENPDVRDRGYIYWRLLSTDSQAARDIVLAEKPKIGEETDNLEPEFLSELISYIGTLMSVFQKPQSAFMEPVRSPSRFLVKEIHTKPNEVTGPAVNSHANAEERDTTPNLLDIDTFEDGEVVDRSSSAADTIGVDLESVLGLSSNTPVLGVEQRQEEPNLVDLFGLLSTGDSETTTPTQPELCVGPKKVWLKAEDAKGLEISGLFTLDAERNIIMDMTFSNTSKDVPAPMTNFAMQLNRNPFRLCPAVPLPLSNLQPGQSSDVQLKLCRSGQPNVMPTPLLQIQVAVKNNVGIFYFAVDMPLVVLLSEDGAIAGTEYISIWRSLPDDVERVWKLNCPADISTETIINRFKAHSIFTVSRQQIDDNEMLYQSMRLIPTAEPLFALVEIRRQNKEAFSVAIKCNNNELTEAVHQAYEDIVSTIR